ncbi:MAG TPA: hypothetical protein VIY73_13025 [Polyangiaceae bacterium]
MTGHAFTYRELTKLRDDLRAAIDKNGHVLPPLEFRRIARIVARLDVSAREIEAVETALVGVRQ